MKVEFNLNYRSLLNERMSLDFSSSSNRGSQGIMLEGRSSREGFDRSNELTSLGLYSEKIMLQSTKVEISSSQSSSPLVQSPVIADPSKADNAVFVEVPKISAQEAADNILGFVERRIQLERDQGASDEELNELLSEARAGVEEGYASARKDLEALGLLSEDLDAEVDQSYSLVDEGLNRIAQDISGNQPETLADAVQAAVVAQAGDDGKAEADSDASESTSSAQAAATSSAASVDYRARYKASSEFSLTTQDGDVVNISFSTKQSFAAAISSSLGEGQFDASARQIDRFNLSVDGELDDGELAAIEDLLGQLSEVSQKFFEGDVLSAFESALAVGFDGSEIAEFSLDLRQSSVERITSRYEQLPSFGSGGESRFQPLVEQASNVELLAAQLSQFEYATEQIRSLFDNVLRTDAAFNNQSDSNLLSNISSFVDRLL